MLPPKKRVPIESITIKLVDGRTKVIEGKELDDPMGGVLVWNDFGAKTVLKGYYKDVAKDDKKANKTEDIWDGKLPKQSKLLMQPEQPEQIEEPSIMIKPTCEPIGWPG